MLARQLSYPARQIIHQTGGYGHGPITRLVSPSDLGQLMKPFVFLDFIDADTRLIPSDIGVGWHPHSGIATVTVMLEGAIHYADTTGKAGTLEAGRVEWMRAGRGVWHTGAAKGSGRFKAFQLWVALPPELENAPSLSQYVQPQDVPGDERVRVILGEYGQAKSVIDAPPMTYLSVSLEPGQRWSFAPPQGHTVAWVAVHEGALRASSMIPKGEVAVFEPSEDPLEFVAEGRTGFVLGSAARHPHPLVLGSYSVHTHAEALRQGELEIRRIGEQLRMSGTINRRTRT
jgi:redox-sensitive bicupin YhaK (pirin superfamily)